MSASSDLISEHLLRQLFNLAGEISPLEFTTKNVGIPGQLLYKMQQLSTRQIKLLASRHSKSILNIEINVAQLERLVSCIDYIDEEMSLAVEFLKKDASLPLMEKMFGFTAYDVRALRDAIGTEKQVGRPKCNVYERDSILASWRKNQSIQERERYLKVADETEISLKVIHMVICQEETRNSGYSKPREELTIRARA